MFIFLRHGMSCLDCKKKKKKEREVERFIVMDRLWLLIRFAPCANRLYRWTKVLAM